MTRETLFFDGRTWLPASRVKWLLTLAFAAGVVFGIIVTVLAR